MIKINLSESDKQDFKYAFGCLTYICLIIWAILVIASVSDILMSFWNYLTSILC